MKTSLKTLKKHARKPADLDEGFNYKTPVLYTFHDQFGEQFAHEIVRMDHTGWFTNEHGETYRDGGGLARGIVASFDPRPGFPNGWFIAGYHCGDNDERVWFLDVFDSAEDAARMADVHARVFAEAQREYNAKWNKAREIETDIELDKHRLIECIALRHKKCMGYVRDEITRLIESIREKRETLRVEYADYC